jgi:bifunctional enzyme CysN/CysC
VPIVPTRRGENGRGVANAERVAHPGANDRSAFARSENVTWEPSCLDRRERWAAIGARGAVLWLTGLPASGKSTLAAAVERRLVTGGRPAYRLDGDNLRHGLNGNLGFGAADRAENVRRTAHVARLFADAGMVAIVSLVSPYAADRDAARAAAKEWDLPFFEIHLATPLDECERRDPKGLYAKARAGELRGMTGIDDPYEPPTDPCLTVWPLARSFDEQVDDLVGLLARGDGVGLPD